MSKVLSKDGTAIAFDRSGQGLTSIDFLLLGAGTCPRAAFLSFSTFLFLVCFLLVHR